MPVDWILGGLGGAGLFWVARRLVHVAILRGLRAPRVPHETGPADLGFSDTQIREVQIPGSQGKRLFGWWLAPSGADGCRERGPAVLVMHGWGANAAMMSPLAPALYAAGWGVLLLDARCHGRSDDDSFTSMPRFAEDIAAGLSWLRDQPEVAADRLAVLGHSVGAAAAMLHAATHADLCAVVSLSAFAHPRDVMLRWMQEKGVPYPLVGGYVLRHVQAVIGASFDDIAPLHTLPRVRCPVLLVHGLNDVTVPVSEARRLADASPHTRLLLVEGDHDLRSALASHGPELVSFLRAANLLRDRQDPAEREGLRGRDSVRESTRFGGGRWV